MYRGVCAPLYLCELEIVCRGARSWIFRDQVTVQSISKVIMGELLSLYIAIDNVCEHNHCTT